MALKLTARFGLDGTAFQTGARRIESRVKQMRAKIGQAFSGVGAQMAGALAGGMLVAKSKETADWGARIRDLGQQFGVTTDFVQALDYAFQQTGGDVESAFKGMRKMAIKMSDATDEMTSKLTRETLQQSFALLGVSIKDLESMKPEQLFMKIAENMRHADTTSGDLHAALNDVFGKGGSQMLVTFGNDLNGMMGRFDELGATVDNETIMKLGAASDKMAEFASRSKPLLADIALGFANVGQYAADGFTMALTTMENLATKAHLLLAGLRPSEADAGPQVVWDQQEEEKGFKGRFMTEDGRRALDDKRGGTDAEKEAHAAKMQEAAEKRRKTAEQIAALEAEEAKRKFDALPPAVKAAQLEQKIREEKAKQLELQKQQNEAASTGADEARKKLEAAKAERDALEGQHGNVDEIINAQAELEELKRRQAALELNNKRLLGGPEQDGKAADEYGVKQAEAAVRGAQSAVDDFVLANPDVDLGFYQAHLANILEMEDEKAKALQSGNMQAVKEYEAGIAAQRAQMEEAHGLSLDQQRDLERRMQMVADAEGMMNLESQLARNPTAAGFQQVKAVQEAEEAKNAAAIEAQQKRMNELKEKYGEAAFNAAATAQSQISQAEAELHAESAALREQHAQAMHDMAEIKSGTSKRFGIDVAEKTASRETAEGALGEVTGMMDRGVENLVQKDDGSWYMDMGTHFVQMGESADEAMKAFQALPDKQKELIKGVEEARAEEAAAIKRQSEMLKPLEAAAQQASTKLQQIEAGAAQQAKAEQMESQKRQAALMAEKAKLDEAAKKDAEAKQKQQAGREKAAKDIMSKSAQEDAAAFRADQLARIGGALGARNPVLDMAKRQYMLQQVQVELARQQAAGIGTLVGK